VVFLINYVMHTHEKYLQKSLDIALESVGNGTGPFGCVIVKDGKIIAKGHNQVTELHDPTAHAEIQAIRHACDFLGSHQLDGCTLYSSCLPCPQCLGAIYWARPEKVFYANSAEEAAAIGFDDSFIYDEFSKPNSKRKYKMERLEISDSLRAFEAWDELDGKVEY